MRPEFASREKPTRRFERQLGAQRHRTATNRAWANGSAGKNRRKRAFAQRQPVGRQRKKPERNQPQFDLRSHLQRILGVDRTALPGFSTVNLHTLFSEVGGDVSGFPTVNTSPRGSASAPTCVG